MNMRKTTQKVTKDFKRQKQGKESPKTYMKRLKKDVLRNNIRFLPLPLQIVLYPLPLLFRIVSRHLLVPHDPMRFISMALV